VINNIQTPLGPVFGEENENCVDCAAHGEGRRGFMAGTSLLNGGFLYDKPEIKTREASTP
jgi:hypothetical protein